MNAASSEQELKDEIEHLERQLTATRSELKQLSQPPSPPPVPPIINHGISINPLPQLIPNPHAYTHFPAPLSPSTHYTHALLLLSDSALPLGSFAFSSGLESYLAHHKHKALPPLHSFHRFLHLSLTSVAGIAIPYIRAAYESPAEIELLDSEFDAVTVCTVARRASVAQGRALLGVWERALRPPASFSSSTTAGISATAAEAATEALTAFSTLLKSPSPIPTPTATAPDPLGPNGHFPPLWSLVCLSLCIPLRQTAYVFLLNHAKAVVSASVRAGVMGPYQAQAVLASQWLQDKIRRGLEGNWDVGREEAGQCVPVLEIWGGRHELLYSRIFNS